MYSKKQITFEFDAGNGSFNSSGNTKITISDARAMAKVAFTGNIGGTTADVTIYGLSMELIAMLSAKGIGASFNALQQIGMNIYANETLIFSGGIYACYANMNTIPEAALIINAVAGVDLARATAKPYSFKGTVSAKEIMESIATPNGYTIEAFGLDGWNGTDPYFTGSPLEQIRQVCSHFDFLMAVSGKKISVWKRKDGINTVIAKVSPENGLIGYPVFTQSGITFQTQFSPYLAAGQQVSLETTLPNASGNYMNNVVEHYISSWMKDGPWITVCQASKIIASQQDATS